MKEISENISSIVGKQQRTFVTGLYAGCAAVQFTAQRKMCYNAPAGTIKAVKRHQSHEQPGS